MTSMPAWDDLRSRPAAAGAPAAGVLLDPLGAPADGAAGLRPPVPLVRRARDRRSGLESFDLLEESGSPARGRPRHRVSGPGSGSAAGPPPALERALQRRRQPGRGVGVDEELPAQARPGRLAEQRPRPRGEERGSATGTESGTRLPRRAARQRQPRLDHRSRRPAVPQRRGAPGRPPKVAPGSQPRARRRGSASSGTC